MKTIRTIPVLLVMLITAAVAGLQSPSGKINIGTTLYDTSGAKVATVIDIGEQKDASGSRVRVVKLKFETCAVEWKNRDTVIKHYRVKEQSES